MERGNNNEYNYINADAERMSEIHTANVEKTVHEQEQTVLDSDKTTEYTQSQYKRINSFLAGLLVL